MAHINTILNMRSLSHRFVVRRCDTTRRCRVCPTTLPVTWWRPSARRNWLPRRRS